MKKTISLFVILCFTLNTFAQTAVNFTINVNNGRKPISPYIYGTNTYQAMSADPLNPSITRFGGNRTSTYNWETNWSNAGSDYYFYNDAWWLSAAGINSSLESISGSVIQSQVDSAKKANRAFMVTLQALGYVSADKNGPVSCDAPCNRWIPVFPNKPGQNYQYPPDKTDNAVYADEEVAWLLSKYGPASSGGIKYYQIDNEPELWNHTHNHIQQNLVTPIELAQKNEAYAKMIRRMDPSARILGYVGFGWWGLVTVDFRTYLKEMKTRSNAYGKPLIDVFDWHFYPNDLQNFTGNKNWDLLQAPRTLWDANYYIPGGSGPMGYYGSAPQLIRRYNTMINEEFPGLKMGISEWNASFDESSVFTGLYVADILGVYGQENIEVATYFDRPSQYAATGFKLFTNYDEHNATYGDTYVEAITSNLPNATVYASTESASNDNKLHVIVISKDMNGPVSGTFTINGSKTYDKAEVYYFEGSSQNIKKGSSITGITGNSFTYTLPKHSAIHFVLTSTISSVVNLTLPATGSSFCQGGASISLGASASTSQGSISKVEFYDDATLIGTVTASPYTYNWTNAGIGSHSITAKATTSTGSSATSSVVTFMVHATPAAPLVTSTQTYCQNATASVLTATGTALTWYTAATGGTGTATAPRPSTAVVGSKDYFVSQTGNGCESPRAKITVLVNVVPAAPLVTATQTYCQNVTASALTATGTALTWYTAATGGTGTAAAPTPSTAVVGSKDYFVSQTSNGCESPRAKITVLVNAVPAAPLVTSTKTYCQNATASVLTATGTALTWYTAASGGTGTAAAPTPSTAVVGSKDYFVSQTGNGCESPGAKITVLVNAVPAAPLVTATQTYCQNATASALTATGTALTWYTSATGGTGTATAPTPSTAVVGSNEYFVSQTGNGCESPGAKIAVLVNAVPAAAITANGSTTIPQGGSVELTANTGSGLTYKWFKGNIPVGTGFSYTATAAGIYTLEVTNTNNCSATSAGKNVNINSNEPSVITITSPTNGSTIQGAITITVNASDPDGSITLVEYLDGNTVIGTGTTLPYSFIWNNPSAGDHEITVRVTDSNGGITTSASVTVISEAITTGLYALNSNTLTGNVYPNPSNGLVFIDSDADLSGARFMLVDVMGNEHAVSQTANGLGAQVDLSTISAGTYVLIIKKDNTVLRKKLTVIK